MILLSIQAVTEDRREPFVVRLNADYGCRNDAHDVYLSDRDGYRSVYETSSGTTLTLVDLDPVAADGDVLLVVPERAVGHRLIRAASSDNTLVFTERCDQRCVMCSQPPKPTHHDVTGFLEEAILLAPPSATLGILGGEPTLYKAALFDLLHRTLAVRKDIAFHILTNGQHFEESDLGVLRSLPTGAVTWGIPIYSADPDTHDAIVRKRDAFDRLCASLEVLCRAGAAIELRTVLMALNADRLGDLAQFITMHVPFAMRWAIMQLENIGYAEQRWSELFVDSSRDFDRLQ
ncbi:MAG: radical superfamily protein [Proteobacteria bacterium]|nr:radical superfamily protein [Pseudomonadota bacterium]